MKKTLYSLAILGGVIAAAVPAMSFAAMVPAPASTFNSPIVYGTKGNADVFAMQQFLFDQGYFKSIPNGNYQSSTKTAVQAFQKSQGISATGNFGPLTMAAANAVIKQNAIDHPVALVGATSIAKTAPKNLVAAIFEIFTGSNGKTLKWSTASYPADLGVNINLIQKVSASPISYTFVRQLGKDVKNTGSFNWTPPSTENGADLYVEVTCGSNTPSTQACQVAGDPIKVN